jgi:radical SAM superfamily enzyme YgiQ (UPF0313 family)
MDIRKITCIQFGGEYPDFCHRVVTPDYGMSLIGTILSEAGYDVRIYMDSIKQPSWERIADSDLICFSCFMAGVEKAYRLAADVRSKLGIPIIIGGTHATYYPESCLDYCDYVVLGEGDATILNLVTTLSEEGAVENVPGIAYRIGDQVHRTAPRRGPSRFSTVPDWSLIEGFGPMSLWERLAKMKIPMVAVQAARGCKFSCAFCPSTTMSPGGYRKRDIESIISDMRDKRRYGETLVIVDNDFGAVRTHAKELLKRMIQENFGFDIFVYARVELSRDDELLDLMRQAGIKYIFQGYESVQPETLAAFDKRQTLNQIIASIEKLQAYEFSIWASFVLGADTDTLDTFQHMTDFVLEQDLSISYFFPLWGHYPEPKYGYQTIVPWYRSIFRGWPYCDGHFVTHFPLQMKPSSLQRAIIDVYRTVYSLTQIARAAARGNIIDARRKLVVRHQWNTIEKAIHPYIPFLEELEDGVYDSSGRLCEDRLIERAQRDGKWTFPAGKRTVESIGLSLFDLPESRSLGRT